MGSAALTFVYFVVPFKYLPILKRFRGGSEEAVRAKQVLRRDSIVMCIAEIESI